MPSSGTRSPNWVFTCNNYTDQHLRCLAELAETDLVVYMIYGKEVGESGTPHLQGFVKFSRRLALSQVRVKLTNCHCEPSRAPKSAIEYCRKDGDVTEYGELPVRQGQRSDLEAFMEDVKQGNHDIKSIRELHPDVCARYPRFVTDYLIDHTPIPTVEDHPMKDWQVELCDYLDNPPDDRTIMFVVDYQGNAGKSWFAKAYHAKHPEHVQIIQPGKKADMAYALDSTKKIIFVDAPRSKQGEYLQYDFLEQLKDQQVFSTKYESRMKFLAKCHVVVFMNEDPDETKLSADRFKYIRIGERPAFTLGT